MMSEQYCGKHDFYYSVNHIIDVICPWCEIDRLKVELEEARSAQFPTIDETAKPTGNGTMVVDCGTYSLELGREATALIKNLECQLDASQALLAEIKRVEANNE